MIGRPQVFYSPGEGGGDGGSDGGDAVATLETGEHWLDTNPAYADVAGDESARNILGRYATEADQVKAHLELRRTASKPYHLPDDPAKLTEAQHAEIDQWRAKARGVPEKPEDYQINVPENLEVSDEIMGEFRQLCHRTGKTDAEANELFGLHLKTLEFFNGERNKIFARMAKGSAKTFEEIDCAGDKELAGSRMEQVRQYLQTFCVDKDGEPDSKEWEKFCVRHFYNGQMMELILMRALHDAARLKLGTGGSPGGGAPTPPEGSRYPTMTANLKRQNRG
ncbi:MAG: hypothetical protein GWN87_28540 [Desulfuromonadales bacterium]|nr:hypothetical protein [Desulfuromonadales bacterium]